jgi:hypothetical protein
VRAGTFSLSGGIVYAPAIACDGPFLFVVDRPHNAVRVYDIERDLTAVGLMGGRSVPELMFPSAMAVCEGFVLIANSGRARLSMFDARSGRPPADWKFMGLSDDVGGSGSSLQDISAAGRWVCALEYVRVRLFTATVEPQRTGLRFEVRSEHTTAVGCACALSVTPTSSAACESIRIFVLCLNSQGRATCECSTCRRSGAGAS